MPPFKDPEDRKKYQREYQRRYVASRRATYLADKCCVECGSTENLEIDHIDPDQKISHRIWSWSDKRLQAELAKTQVLCNTHHKMKTFGWQSEEQPHGRSRYDKGCRCLTCRNAKRKTDGRVPFVG